MNISWFPGHMTKSLRMMESEVKNIDMIIYLLDARAPMSCFNPKFNQIVGNKPVLYVLNKFDLADDKKTNEFANMLEKEGMRVIKLNAAKSGAGKVIEPILKKMFEAKIQKFGAKGITVLPKAMVIGVPNVGKSTLINNLAAKGKALTGNKPGVTRGKQSITLESGIQLVDTPGTLWPSFEQEKTAIYLALIGSIKDDVVDMNELAYHLVEYLAKHYPNQIEKRYNLAALAETTHEVVEQIARSRGFVLKGGEEDIDRTCQMLVNEFRKGQLGNITLD